MSDKPQNNVNSAPQEMPPIPPTQAFPSPGYMPPAQAAIPMQETYMPNTAPPSAIIHPQGYAPVPPPAMQKKRGGPLVWVLGGCGVLAVLVVVAGASLVKNITDQVGRSDVAKNKSTIPTARQHLVQIRAALNEYAQAHEGKYPASLDEIVDASLLSYTTGSGQAVKVEYTPPAPDAPEDAGVAGFYVGHMSMSIGRTVDQRVYYRLLKNGSIVSEQIVRTADTNL